MVLASPDVVAGGVFHKYRAESLLIIYELKSVFLRKLGNLCLAIFFCYWPDALQFLLVDRAMPQIVRLQLQFTSDQSGENLHRGYFGVRLIRLPGVGVST